MSWAGEVGGARDWFPNSYRFATEAEAKSFIDQVRAQWVPADFVREVRVRWEDAPINARWDSKKQEAIQLNVLINDEEAEQDTRPVCQCNHTAAYLFEEIKARRWVHEYRERPDSEDEEGDEALDLICLKCGCLWDHAATDRLMEFIAHGTAPAARRPKQRRQR